MNVRLSILLVVVLALIGGSVIITRELSTKEQPQREDWLYRVNLEDIKSISVTHLDSQMDYTYDGEQWVIKDGEDTPVYVDKWAGTTLLLSGPRSSRSLADTVDDPAKFGLDFPQTTVRLVDKSGVPLQFYLGDATPDGKSWYATLEGSPRLFTVDSTWSDVITKLATEPPYPPTPTPVPPAEEDEEPADEPDVRASQPAENS